MDTAYTNNDIAACMDSNDSIAVDPHFVPMQDLLQQKEQDIKKK